MTAHADAGPVGAARRLDGYAVVMPPGWRRIPVRHGTDEAIRRIADGAYGQAPSSVSREQLVRPKIQLRQRLTALAAQVREKNGLDLYLPVELRHGTAIPASFAVSAGPLPLAGQDGRDADPTEVVAYLASLGEGSSLVSLDGVPAARTEHTEPEDPQQNLPGSRRVDYVVPVPESPGTWLVVAFSTIGDGDPAGEFAGILVTLFDAIMSTFRWTWLDGPAQTSGTAE